MTPEALPDFNRPDLARAVEALRPETIDRLPYGAIRLDRSGQVVFFSKAEASLSGFGDRPSKGFDFFRDIAPCMNTDNFRGRLERAMAAGSVNIELTHIGDFNERERELCVRILSASDGGCWIFMSRD